MNSVKEVRGRTECEIRTCPYCFKPLGMIEATKRKIFKICTCKRCKRIIDERHIIW